MAGNNSEEYRIYINGLGPYIDYRELQHIYESFGETFHYLCVPFKGFGLISYRNELNAIHAIASTHNKILRGFRIQVEWARGWPKTRSRPKKYNWVISEVTWNNVRVKCSELKGNVTEEILQEIFSPFGTTEIRLLLDLEYAVIRFNTKEAAALAISTVDGTKICDTPVQCEWYHRAEYSNHPNLASNLPGHIHLPAFRSNSCNIPVLSSASSLSSAAPTSYSAASSSYSAAPTSYSAAPRSYSAAPRSYPAAPSSYPAAPSSYPAAPSSYSAASSLYSSASSSSSTITSSSSTISRSYSAASSSYSTLRPSASSSYSTLSPSASSSYSTLSPSASALPSFSVSPFLSTAANFNSDRANADNFSREIQELVTYFNRAVGTPVHSAANMSNNSGQGATSNNSASGTAASFNSKSDAALQQEDQDEPKKETKEKTDLLCKICMDKEYCVVFLDCGHVVTCVDCAKKVNNCPLCRKAIVKKIKAYLS